jgi:hypothetical protein
VASIKTPNGVLKFNSVLHAIRFIFGLPCLNVVVERLFSILKTVKNEKKNGFKNVTLAATISVKYGMKRKGPNTFTESLKKKRKSVESDATASECVAFLGIGKDYGDGDDNADSGY